MLGQSSPSSEESPGRFLLDGVFEEVLVDLDLLSLLSDLDERSDIARVAFELDDVVGAIHVNKDF